MIQTVRHSRQPDQWIDITASEDGQRYNSLISKMQVVTVEDKPLAGESVNDASVKERLLAKIGKQADKMGLIEFYDLRQPIPYENDIRKVAELTVVAKTQNL